MATIVKNTIFTNVAETSDGGVFWEGMDQSLPEGVTITSWKNKRWSSEEGNTVKCEIRTETNTSSIFNKTKKAEKLTDKNVSL